MLKHELQTLLKQISVSTTKVHVETSFRLWKTLMLLTTNEFMLKHLQSSGKAFIFNNMKFMLLNMSVFPELWKTLIFNNKSSC